MMTILVCPAGTLNTVIACYYGPFMDSKTSNILKTLLDII